jgi:RNA polymerase sigma-70 factor (ECF subfamily)
METLFRPVVVRAVLVSLVRLRAPARVRSRVGADLIQGFFAALIDGKLLLSADPLKGRFWSYLLGALKHFIANERDRAAAQKRGGGVASVSLCDAESRYAAEPADNLSPERLFERRWALTLLDRVMQLLAHEYEQAGKQQQFAQLKNLIGGPLPDRSYADIAAELGTTEGAVKTAVHRMRQHYRELLTAQIAETVATPQDVKDEIRHLYSAISGACS